jgi:thiamine biosynthesis lipoprotein
MLAHGYDRDFALVGSRGSTPAIQTTPAPGCAGIAIDVTTSSVVLPAGAAFDSGGIGKGLAADLVSAELVRDGADGVIVNVGGDLRVRGRSPHTQGWIITVPDPSSSDRELLRMAMPDGAVATSSTLRRSWRHGADRVHHLMDPRTGRPVDGRIVSATVVTTTAWLAEVYAKAVVVGSVTDFAELPATVEVAAVNGTGARLVSDGLRKALLP